MLQKGEGITDEAIKRLPHLPRVSEILENSGDWIEVVALIAERETRGLKMQKTTAHFFLLFCEWVSCLHECL